MTYVFYTNDDYINNPVTGGTRRFIELVTGLLRKGHIVHLFIPAHANFPNHPNLVRHPLKRRVNRFLPNGLLNFFSNYRQLRKIRRINGTRVVFISVPYAIQGLLAGIRKPTLVVWEDFVDYRRIWFESLNVPSFIVWVFKIWWRYLERFTLIRAGRIIVQCHYDRDVLINRHQPFAEKISSKINILNNNVNPTWIEQKAHLRDRVGEQKISRPYNLGFIGNLDDTRKGLHLLLDSFVRLVDEGFAARLHVIGEGRLRKSYMDQYKPRPQITFYGKIEFPMKSLATFDMLVVPSLSDSFPNTIMEALYLGVPVMGSKRGGIPEILSYDELLFEPTEEALYSKLAEVLNEDGLTKTRELCLRRREVLEFDWVESMQQIL